MAKTEKILIDNICPLHDLECEKAVLGTLTTPYPTGRSRRI